MKRIVTLMLAIAMVAGAAFSASAATDINVSGNMFFYYQWADNTDFNDGEADGQSEDDFLAAQRIRTQVEFVTENVTGVLNFEIDQVWGRGTSDGTNTGTNNGGAIDNNSVNIETRRAYLDFDIPGTEIGLRIGDQGIALPGAVAGSAILDANVSAVLADYTFNEMFDVKGLWARTADANGGNTATAGDYDETDVFGVIAGIHLDGIEVVPFVTYASVGFANDPADAWWAGAATTVNMFDPLTVAFDLNYGSIDREEETNDSEGWLFAGKVSYKLDMVTPGIVAWYATGDDDDASDGSEMMPELEANWLSSSFAYADGWGPTSYEIMGDTPAGTWAIGLELADIKLIDDLTSTFKVFYHKGTNDSDMVDRTDRAVAGAAYLTDEDHVWEVTLDNTYAIYENLSLITNFGYMNLDLDEETWDLENTDADYSDSAWKAAFVLNYSF